MVEWMLSPLHPALAVTWLTVLIGLALLGSPAAQPEAVHVRGYGAVPDDGHDDTEAIRRAFRSSRRGQQVRFDTGTYDLKGELALRSERAYIGDGTVLKRTGGEFLARIEGNASDVTLRGFRFEGGGLFMGDGRLYRNIRITDNMFSDIDGHAIKITIASDQVLMERNTFENVRGYGVIETFNTNRLSYRFNRIIDCAHGGHILGPKDDNVVAYNHMTGLVIMGIEIQSLGDSVSRNLTVQGNVIYDWRSTNSQAMGLSVPCCFGLNTRINNNYINCNLAAEEKWIDAKDRLPAVGTVIEACYHTGEIRGNTFGGTYWFPIGAATNHKPPRFTSVIEDNTFYGASITGYSPIVQWPNENGPSTWTEGHGNRWDKDNAKMPSPESWLRTISELSAQTEPTSRTSERAP